MPNPLRISQLRFHRCGRKCIIAFFEALSTRLMNFFLFFCSSALRTPFRSFFPPRVFRPADLSGGGTGAVDSLLSSPALHTIASLPQPPSPPEKFFSLFFPRPATHQSIHFTGDKSSPGNPRDGLSIRGRVKEYPLSTPGKAPETIFLFFLLGRCLFQGFPNPNRPVSRPDFHTKIQGAAQYIRGIPAVNPHRRFFSRK